MGANDNNSNTFWDRQISIWHLIYIAIICLIIIIAVLVIIPGRINEDAYQNFSFASTITSIVLAAVSIIYSIQSGLATGSQMSDVKSIEHNISKEVAKLSGIDKNIRDIIRPLTETVGQISDTQNTMQQTQSKLVAHVEKLSLNFEPIEVLQSGGDKIKIKGPVVLSVTIYAAIMSRQTGMDIPFHKFAEYIGKQATYCEGLLDGLAAVHPDKISISVGSKKTRKVVHTFDEAYFGDAAFWESKTKEINNTRISDQLLKAIKDYYSHHSNQEIEIDCVK